MEFVRELQDDGHDLMPGTDAKSWSDLLCRVLGNYAEPLLRQVAGSLVKPRNQWPVDELIARTVATVSNAAVIDRRLKEAGLAERRLLALIGHSRQPHWKLIGLLQLQGTLGHSEGLAPVLNLLRAGLLYPHMPAGEPPLKSFESWLSLGSATHFPLFAHPDVTARALGEDLGLPALNGTTTITGEREADGLEWPLRLAVLWQQVSACPIRRTQSAEFFKRDLDRLREDPLLNSSPSENLADLPDMGLLAVALAIAQGILEDKDGELQAGTLPLAWSEGQLPTLASLWQALPHLESWEPKSGWWGRATLMANPYSSAYLLALLLLTRLPHDHWIRPGLIEEWIRDHHPFWAGGGIDWPPQGSKETTRAAGIKPFLLGFAFQLRLLRAARDTEGEWVVSLSDIGRWLLGMGPAPAAPPIYPQTLLVQPNLEILAYRQGLTPEVIAGLSRFASWKTLGAACTLQLEPDTVYRALEEGETFESIMQTLERHGMKATPAPVIESLKTWANKRERIGVYSSAVLLEFTSPEHLKDAIARGLPAVRLSDRLAVVQRESDVNFQMFRLTGSRDYALPPDKCVDIEPDGVTLTIDLARSDLLLETEIQRFAEPVPVHAGAGRTDHDLGNGRRQYRLTPASLAAGRESGLSLTSLESWFVQRTGQALSPATRLLLSGSELPSFELRRLHVLNLPARELADGLVQWPATRDLILERLGPTALVVSEESIDLLRERLQTLGVKVNGEW
jgi:hypothetical protein